MNAKGSNQLRYYTKHPVRSLNILRRSNFVLHLAFLLGHLTNDFQLHYRLYREG